MGVAITAAPKTDSSPACDAEAIHNDFYVQKDHKDGTGAQILLQKARHNKYAETRPLLLKEPVSKQYYDRMSL